VKAAGFWKTLQRLKKRRYAALIAAASIHPTLAVAIDLRTVQHDTWLYHVKKEMGAHRFIVAFNRQ